MNICTDKFQPGDYLLKAAFFTGSQQIEIRQIPDVHAPDDGLVLQVMACGVCGSDLRRWEEDLPAGSEPVIPGHEIAGIVTEVGSNVHAFQVGDRLAVAPDVHCGKCYYCARGLYNLCDNLRLVGIMVGYPGGFAEQMILTGEILTNGIVHPMP